MSAIRRRADMTHIGHVACNQINGRYERGVALTKVRVAGFSISLDGFGEGPEQSLDYPLGKRGLELHRWMFGTRMFQTMIGKDGGSDGVDEAYAYRSMDGFGAQSCWIFQMAQMSTWYRYIAIDLPGYGKSPKARAGLTMQDIAQACWEALGKLHQVRSTGVRGKPGHRKLMDLQICSRRLYRLVISRRFGFDAATV